MENIVPKIDQWVECKGRYYGPGKVMQVDLNKRTFRGYFYQEDYPEGKPDFQDACEDIPFGDIEHVITDPLEIERMEMDLNGYS